MKYVVSSIIVLFLLASCNDYQEILKSGKVGEKFKLGDSLYHLGKFDKANRLFAQIVPNYRGKPQAEKLMFLYSSSFYEMKDYYVAGYQFERFVSSYPKSLRREEAAFLSAKSYYMLSPKYTKDQKETKDAIEKLQEFINVYPKSKHVSEANKLVQELDFKLEKKAFEIAKQYNLIQDYEASIQSIDNFVFEFPGSSLREEALYCRLDAAYKLAINSVERKKEKRLKTAKEYYTAFKSTFGKSKYIPEIDNMAEKLEKELETYSAKS